MESKINSNNTNNKIRDEKTMKFSIENAEA